MWYFVLCLFAILSIIPTLASSSENAAYIDAAVTAIATASSGTADVLMSLSGLGAYAAFFLKVIVTVGSVIVGELNPEPESDVYKQLMDLKIRTDNIWWLNQRGIDTATRAIGLKIMTSQYITKVVHPINVMKNMTNEYVDPTIYKSRIFVDDYKSICKSGEKAPEEILAYLITHLVTSCNAPMSHNDAQRLANQRAYLAHVIVRLNVESGEVPDIDLYLKEYLSIKQKFGDKHISTLDLKVFNRRFATYASAVSAFFQEIKKNQGSFNDRKENESDQICFLRELISGTNFNFPKIEAYAIQLRDDLIDLGYIAGICANLSYDGHQPSMEKYAKKVAENIELIATHTAKWLNESLDSAWPAIHQQILLEQIMRIVPSPGEVIHDDLEVVIQLALPQLIATGTPNFVYQILIDAIPGGEQFFEGFEKYCFFHKNVYGFETIINRMPINFTNELEKENVHAHMMDMADYASSFNTLIQEVMGKVYNAPELPIIVDALKAKIGDKLISEKKFHCWSVLRMFSNWPWKHALQLNTQNSLMDTVTCAAA